MKVIRTHMLIAAFLAGAACIGAILVWQSGASASTAASAAPTTDATAAAPTWLQDQTTVMLHRFLGGQAATQAVSSLSWVKTTWGQYEAAVGGGGDPGSTNGAYVVIAQGHFQSDLAPGVKANDKPIAVSVIVMTFDEATQKPSTIDALYSADGISEAMLGQMIPMTVPAAD
jgi:hypothetical protein